MKKRRCSGLPDHDRQVKRPRTKAHDVFSRFSDELLLRTLSFLSVSDLARCARLCQRFHAVAGDSQLWKASYYNRFVLPRVLRLPHIRDCATGEYGVPWSSKVSKWMDEAYLVKRGTETNWKRQYKLRHNWSRGSCTLSEIEVAESSPVPQILVCLHYGIIFTADAGAGLRAWELGKERKLLASINLSGSKAVRGAVRPTALAVDVQSRQKGIIPCVIGFENGGYSVYHLDQHDSTFHHLYSHAPSTNGTISAIAFASPFLLTITESQLLSLYRFPEPQEAPSGTILDPPRLLSSLNSPTAWPPLSLSVRIASNHVIASIAYALPTYRCGWSVGLQELRLTSSGAIIESRLTSAIGHGFRPLKSSPPPSPTSTSPLHPAPQAPSFSKPTSLSYTHPYLLASHPDNTLTLYLVTSTSSSLSISPGARLWGHTSSVSSAHVGGRGKAVSVSARGDEVRVWELEGGAAVAGGRKRNLGGGGGAGAGAGALSVRVTPEVAVAEAEAADVGAAAEEGMRREGEGEGEGEGVGEGERYFEDGKWVGFDEENVIVLRGRDGGARALAVYDFS